MVEQLTIQNEQQNIFEQIFEGNEITMLNDYENPVFITNQICKALEIRSNQPWLNDIKQEFQGGTLLEAQNIPKYRGQQLSVITERGVIEIISRAQSPNAKKFRDFIYLLLKNLRLGKIKVVFTQIEQLTQEKLQLLEDKQELIQQNEEQKQTIQQQENTIEQIDADFDFLHESASQICQKERTKIPNNKSKDEFLVIIKMDDNLYKIHCVQRYKKNNIVNQFFDDVVFNQQCVSAKQFWNACHELLKKNGQITGKTLLISLHNMSEDEFTDFLEEQIEVMKQVPEND